jgi:hypothetical protein
LLVVAVAGVLGHQQVLHAVDFELKRSTGALDGAAWGKVQASIVLPSFSQAVLGGKANPTEDDVKKILGSGTCRWDDGAAVQSGAASP